MIGTGEVAAAAARAATAMATHEDELNSADGRIGDGDTGQTLRRLSAAISAAAAQEGDVGAQLKAMSLAAAGATGSSLGTLVTVGLREMGKSLAGRAEVDLSELAAALAAAEATMLARGQVSLGDKTAIDMLHAVRLAVESGSEAVTQAAERTLAAFRDKPCRAGRAGRFAEKTVGLPDPGMLAFAYLALAIASGDGKATPLQES